MGTRRVLPINLVITAAFVAFVSILAASVISWLGRDQTPRASLESRIEQLSKSLEEAVRDTVEIEEEIRQRQQLVLELQQDQQRYEELKRLGEPQVRAVIQSLHGEIDRSDRRAFWQNFWLTAAAGFFFLLAGVALDRWFIPWIAKKIHLDR